MEQKKNYSMPLAFLTMLFFMWGFITCLNDILIPHFKAIFILSYFESMLIQFAFFGAYFVGSLIYFIISSASGDPINKIGYKNGIMLGLLIAALGTFLFYPAAQLHSFGFFLVALFVLALGFTLLQIAANPYVILLGNPETGSHRLNLAGAINSFGTTIAPIIGGTFILANTNSASDIDSVKMPYLVFTGIFLLLVLVFKLAPLPKFANEQNIEKGMGALKFPQLTLGVLAIFFYVGAEVTVGSFMTNFVGLPEIMGIPAKAATIYVALYWSSIMIGRFAGSASVFKFSSLGKKIFTAVMPVLTFFFILLVFKLKAEENEVIDFKSMMVYLPFIFISIIAFYIGQEKAARTLFLFSVICILLLVLSLSTTGPLAMWSIISLGLYNSIMWPSIFALAIAGLGKYTSQGSSLLIMAILGGALIPPLQGLLADSMGVHFSFIVPVLCYVYLAFYAWKVPLLLKSQGIENGAVKSEIN
ncbi:MAG: sugar MFS transporter [Bacteroidetes bacterium]|nr:sugar MFS transporter [Bacteroidota bacterium]